MLGSGHNFAKCNKKNILQGCSMFLSLYRFKQVHILKSRFSGQGLVPVCVSSFWKCNVPMNTHGRPLVGPSVGQYVNITKRMEVTLPCSYRSTCC